ncbi:4Fe-4S single cluster domain-containing protein [Rhizobium leguminosarum]|uniref:4Fe-4S single cluster domain-containing protein n=1 Tax=Rhizobium leguminosarum TaxID=384 RepID=UPI003D0656B6
MTVIAISRLHFPVTTLGPGNRVGVWFQGCSIRCPACISADTWANGGGQTTVDDVLAVLAEWLPHSDGITISGGEPFDQPDALKALVTALRRQTDGDILAYSGHPYEMIAHMISEMAGSLDAIICDPYLVDAPQTLALRGSDNQRLIPLTSLGASRFSPYERAAVAEDRRFDLMMDGDGQVWMAGIPARDDFNRLKSTLATKHHKIITTQDRSPR